ncbi:NADH-quinone oxidoreductase subunit J [Rhodovastum atsumiense]|uniref:NADH-quinone oxidoreductase subunit J n=1 Tax=Rhodovastum atsumiense TaxID=504468 RepID=A0A5M6IJA1_9PROT|nr:proton-conducting transporter membrane subunit [Rhodovastum atsumiense]KAA5608344.1 NADH-quinone oxidoreductase subunit J [Rhodovastum atsumiense]CAH2602342.1 NADH-quinone oxidoreductase subunit J [Rhodovastum atsumiense]
MTATVNGYLLVLALVLPVAATLAAPLPGGRHAERITLLLLPAGLAVALAIAASVLGAGAPLVYLLGGWVPPLGIALRADGFSAAMLVTTALVIGATALVARDGFRTPPDVVEARRPLVFWTLLPALWAALTAVFVGGDLFNLYVGLELLTFAGLPLVCLDGGAATLAAALRYLLFVLLGSVLYLLGTALVYGTWGTLDIALLAQRIQPGPTAAIAATLMTTGLLAKTALFPLHLWLPPAHAGAPAAASAVLSALVVKASFFLIVRLWFDAMPGVFTQSAAQFLAALGAGAILVGGVLALRQARLKPLIAWSTVAQIGYLFLLFPLASGTSPTWNLVAWTGGLLQAISHALAKAAMFLAAGLVAGALGHDRIAGLAGLARVLPMTVLALGLAGLSLVGVPPSGGFAAKWLLLRAAIASGQWWWALVVLGGGLLAGGYVFRILAPALGGAAEPPHLRARVSRGREAVVLALALCSVLIGLLPLGAFGLLRIGRPELMTVALP